MANPTYDIITNNNPLIVTKVSANSHLVIKVANSTSECRYVIGSGRSGTSIREIVGIVSENFFNYGGEQTSDVDVNATSNAVSRQINGVTYYIAIISIGSYSVSGGKTSVLDNFTIVEDTGFTGSDDVKRNTSYKYTFGDEAVSPLEPIQVDIPVLFKKYSKTYEAKQTITVNPPSN